MQRHLLESGLALLQPNPGLFLSVKLERRARLKGSFLPLPFSYICLLSVSSSVLLSHLSATNKPWLGCMAAKRSKTADVIVVQTSQEEKETMPGWD
jgi:hypothetical protein